MDDVKFATMNPHLDKWLHGEAALMTDEFKAYNRLGKFWKWHIRVHHGADEFVRGDAHVNTAESFNATLKRAQVGVYHYMSPKHLLRYVEEAVFRSNHRIHEHRTLGRLSLIIGTAVSRHMPYEVLIA
jgi:hypothetical protein